MHLYLAAGEQVSTLLLNSLSWSNLWNTSVGVAFMRACLVAPWQPKLLQSKDLCSELQGGISHNTLLAQFLTLSSSLEAFFFLDFQLAQERKNIKEREPLGLDVHRVPPAPALLLS